MECSSLETILGVQVRARSTAGQRLFKSILVYRSRLVRASLLPQAIVHVFSGTDPLEGGPFRPVRRSR
jgi:hypothetical protein